MTPEIIRELQDARRAEKEQALFYRGLITHAENAGHTQVAEDLNGLHADEQHHLSRLTVRLVEADQTVEDLGSVRMLETSYVGWETEARSRELDEIARYERIAAQLLDSLTAALIVEILNAERQHAETLGGKFMSA
ncbi:MAG: hypothetical protein WEE89_18330 [Gemmatimonadota bacterium]